MHYLYRMHTAADFKTCILQRLDETPGGGPAVSRLLGRLVKSLVHSKLIPENQLSMTRTAQALHAVALEKLHLGVWKDVPLVWRDTFSATCIVLAILEKERSNLTDMNPALLTRTAMGDGHELGCLLKASIPLNLNRALEYLDKAVLMGGPTLRHIADRMIDSVMEISGVSRLIEETAEAADNGFPLPPFWDAQESRTCWRKDRDVDASDRLQGVYDGGRQEEESAKTDQKGVVSLEWDKVDNQIAGRSEEGSMAPSHDVLLPEASLGPRGTPIEEIDEGLPSLEAFAATWLSRRPVIISGGMLQSWPAMKRWKSGAYLLAVAGPRLVPVEEGTSYLEDDWRQKLMKFSDFWSTCMLQRMQSTTTRSVHATKKRAHQPSEHLHPSHGDDDAMTIQCDGSDSHIQQRLKQTSRLDESSHSINHDMPSHSYQHRKSVLYLAQHELLDQIPSFRRDIHEPEYCVLGEEGDVPRVNAWLGPAGTVTPCHTDPYHNLLCQVVGRKYVRLYSPNSTDTLYPFSEGMHSNSSQVDFDAPLETVTKQFPLFPDEPFFDGILESGQAMYIPPGWWHYVKSLTPSASVSFWWK